MDGHCREEQSLGRTVVLVAISSTIVGSISITDPPKPEAKEVIGALEAQHIECYMVTGTQLLP